MKTIYCLILFLTIFSIQSSSQTLYEGKIINSTTKDPIPNLTMSFVKNKIKLKTDQFGSIIIRTVKIEENDTVILSGVGFVKIAIPWKNFRKKGINEVKESISLLKEVKIFNKPLQKKLNNFSKGNFMAYIFDYQVAQEFNCPEGYDKLKEITIALYNNYYDNNGSFKFRIRIYDVNKTGPGPGDDLCNQNLEIDCSGKNKLDIDLSKYDIVIPNKKFFVAIEKLFIPCNERYSLYLDYNQVNSDVLDEFKIKLLNHNTYYEPVIYYKQTKEKLNWAVDFPGGKWTSNRKGILGISALITN